MSRWGASLRRGWTCGMELWNEILRLTKTHAFFYFLRLVWQSFVRNRCLVRASSLAYTTLLALIPVLAVALSVATNLIAKDGEEGRAQVEQLIEYLVVTVAPMLDLEVKEGGAENESANTEGMAFGGQDGDGEVMSRRKEVARSIHEYINNIHAKTIGVTSVVVFIVMAVLLFRSIESTFNDIWGVKRGRGWYASLVQYWTSITLGPILLILALGVSSSTHFSRSLEWVRELDGVGSFVLFSVSWGLYAVACSVLYKVMPKTEVQVRSALVGGAVAGFLLQLNNKLSFLYFSNVATTDRVYGSLGAAPMLLLGLFVSWTILLFGAQVAYAYQNYHSYLQARWADRVHHAGREFLALRIMALISKRFMEGENAPSLQELADQLGVASGLTAEVVEQLEENELVSEVRDQIPGYLPTRPPIAITVEDVLRAIRYGRGIDIESADDEACARIRDAYQRVSSATAEVSRGMSMAAFSTDGHQKPSSA